MANGFRQRPWEPRAGPQPIFAQTMAIPPDNLADFEAALNKIATELVLVQPGSDDCLVPVYSLLSDLLDACQADARMAEAAEAAKATLDQLLDGARPFDAVTIDYLRDFTNWAQTQVGNLRAGKGAEPFEGGPAATNGVKPQPGTPAELEAEPPAPAEPTGPQKVEGEADAAEPEKGASAPGEAAGADATPPEEPGLDPKVDVLLELNLPEDQELLAEFQTEAIEHLEAIENGTLTLEHEPRNADALAGLFRAFHTIKGVAGFLHLTPVQALAHEVESLLDHARNHELLIDSAMIDSILQARDTLQALVNQVSAALDHGQAPSERVPVSPLVGKVRQQTQAALAREAPAGNPGKEEPAAQEPPAEAGSEQASPPAAAAEEPATGRSEDAGGTQGFFDTGAVSAGDDEPFVERNGETGAPPPRMTRPGPGEATAGSGETASLPQAAPRQNPPAAKAEAAGNASGNGAGAAERATIRVNTGKLDNLMDMVGELVIVQSQLSESARGHATENTPLQRNLGQLSRITKELQHTSMALRMVPIRSTFQKTTRIVREVAQQCGKKVNFITEGEDTELDRTVVEQIGDPLVHMIRNAVDHGVEPPAERLAAGKEETGTVRLAAYHLGSNIVIELSDDGRGMDPQKILAKARERGLLEEGLAVSDAAAYQYIFAPGFSTAAQLSDVSGRGVGMDVVKKNIEKLRGAVEIESAIGEGSIFKIKLPLTMAIIDGLVVRVGTDKFILPTTSVKVCLHPAADQISKIQGRAEVLDLRGKTIPIVRLHERFGIETEVRELTQGILVVTEHFGKPYALLVDEMVSKQEVVIKSLGKMMQGIEGVAGGAILGDGTIAIILDPSGLFRG